MRICSIYCLFELEWFASTMQAGLTRSRFAYNSWSSHQILVVIIWQALAMLADCAAQDGVGIWVSVGFYLPVTHDEFVTVLAGLNRVHHNRQVTAGRILHTDRNVAAAGYQTMLLVFYGAGTDCDVGHDIIQVADIVRVKHLICGGEAGFFQDTHMHMADGVQALCHTWPLLRVRLMEHALVAVTGGTRLVGVDTRYDNKTVFGLFLDIDQAAGVVQDRILVIGGTRSDDDQKFVAFSADNPSLLPHHVLL